MLKEHKQTYLTAISESYYEVIKGIRRRMIRVRCRCGVEKPISYYRYKHKETLSCGCLRVERRAIKHDISIGDEYNQLKITNIYTRITYSSKGQRITKILCDVECTCGTKKKGVLKTNIVSGLTRSCGCLHEVARKNSRKQHYKDEVIGLYTLIEYRGYDNKDPSREVYNHNYQIWSAKCSCGGEVELPIYKMQERVRCSCKPQSMYLNQTFNRLTVKKVYTENRNQYALCDCQCGKTGFKARLSSVVKGYTKHCGCQKVSKQERG